MIGSCFVSKLGQTASELCRVVFFNTQIDQSLDKLDVVLVKCEHGLTFGLVAHLTSDGRLVVFAHAQIVYDQCEPGFFLFDNEFARGNVLFLNEYAVDEPLDRFVVSVHGAFEGTVLALLGALISQRTLEHHRYFVHSQFSLGTHATDCHRVRATVLDHAFVNSQHQFLSQSAY